MQTLDNDDRLAAIKEIKKAIDAIDNDYPSPARLHLKFALNSLSVPSDFNMNKWNTTQLTLNIMSLVARQVGVNINDDDVADKLYEICCDLESYPEDQGFGSSDSFDYYLQAQEAFGTKERQS